MTTEGPSTPAVAPVAVPPPDRACQEVLSQRGIATHFRNHPLTYISAIFQARKHLWCAAAQPHGLFAEVLGWCERSVQKGLARPAGLQAGDALGGTVFVQSCWCCCQGPLDLMHCLQHNACGRCMRFSHVSHQLPTPTPASSGLVVVAVSLGNMPIIKVPVTAGNCCNKRWARPLVCF